MIGDAVGYVYVMQNERSLDIKVGMTTTSIDQRERELHSTGMAVPLRALFSVIVKQPYEVEKEAHQGLARWRIAENREFFSCTPHEAIKEIKAAATKLDCRILEEWSSSSISIDDECDISQFPEQSREIVQRAIRRAVEAIDQGSVLATLLIAKGPELATQNNLDEVLSWNAHAQKILRQIGDAAYAPQSVLDIRRYCGGIPVDLTESLINGLLKHLRRIGKYDDAESPLKAIRVRLALNMKFIEGLYDAMSPVFLDSPACRSFNRTSSEINATLMQLEEFTLSMSGESDFNRDSCISLLGKMSTVSTGTLRQLELAINSEEYLRGAYDSLN